MEAQLLRTLIQTVARPGFYMVIECCDCKALIGYKRCSIEQHGTKTHTYCKSCLDKLYKEQGWK